MSLSNKLIQDFVNATNDMKKEKTDTYVYGTIHKTIEGEYMVRLDGSASFTPITTGIEVENQDRVMVLIKDHTAIVMANYTNKATSAGKVDDIVQSNNEIIYGNVSNNMTIYVGNVVEGVYTNVNASIESSVENAVIDMNNTLVNATNSIYNNVNNAMNGIGCAQISANNKNRVFYLNGQNGDDGVPTVWPVGTAQQPLIVNDIWYNTGEGYCIYNWNGTKWIRRAMEHQAIASIDIGKATVGILSAANIDTSTLRGKRLESNEIVSAYFHGGIVDVGGVADISGAINLYNGTGSKFGAIDSRGLRLQSTGNDVKYIRIENGGISATSTKGVGIGDNFVDVWINDSAGKLKSKAIMTNINNYSYIGITNASNVITSYISDIGNLFAKDSVFKGNVSLDNETYINKDIHMTAYSGITVGASYIIQQTDDYDVSINAINVNAGLLKLGHEGTKYINAGVPFNNISVDTSLVMYNNRYISFVNAGGIQQWQVGLSLNDNAHLFSQPSYLGTLSIGHQSTTSTQISGKSGTVFLGESTHSYFRVPAVANNTTTSAANVNVASNGAIRMTTSTKKDKLVVEDLELPFDNILNIKPKTWHDRHNAELYAELLTRLDNGELTEQEVDNACVEDINKRTEGVLAEDFVENGLGIYCDLDDNGEVIGFHGSIAWTALLPVVKRLKDRIDVLEQQIQNGKEV